jgi:YD repeat-containing protein
MTVCRSKYRKACMFQSMPFPQFWFHNAFRAAFLCVCLSALPSARAETPATRESLPLAANHRAVAITDAGEAVLRDDGRVIAFGNKSREGGEPVFIEGLTDIVDIAGQSGGLGRLRTRGSAYWIALRRDGAVFEWDGSCASEGYLDCRYSRAKAVSRLHGIVAISSGDGTHLAVDRDGQAWGWGWDQDGLITSRHGERGARSRLIKSPIQIPVPTPLKAIAVGTPHAMGIDRAGGVWIWSGNNSLEFQPEQSELTSRGTFVTRKVIGLPPARSGKALGQSYVVTDKGELWSWGVGELNHVPSGRREVHRIEEVCPIRSAAFNGGLIVVVCDDGSIQRMLLPGVSRRLPMMIEERWEKIEGFSDVERVHVATSAFAVSLITRSGAVYRGGLVGAEDMLSPAHQMIGPLNLNPQRELR